MRAEILSVGTELLLGQIVDTNANYLAQQLPPLGLDLYYVSQIGDNLGRLADAFRRALERSDVIIATGTYLPNPVGTAPGWWVERDGGEKIIVAMPGVPHEMRKMWEEQVMPRLARRVTGAMIVSRVLKLVGIGESHAEEALR